MADRQRLVPERNTKPKESFCSPSTKISQNVLDKVSLCAIIFVFLGLICTSIGFLYPRDLTRDPAASARENEAIDENYMHLSTILNIVVITGVVLIGLGGIVSALIFTKTVLCQEYQQMGCRKDSDSHMLTTPTEGQQQLQKPDGAIAVPDYGTVSSNSAKP